MKDLMVSLKAIVVLTLLTGLVYPLAVTLLGNLLFAHKAQGSLVLQKKKVLGSELIARSFTQGKYFWPRPSAVKYDPASSGGSNQSVASVDLMKAVWEREARGAVADMKFASASGLDPHISPEAARSQVARVAQARGMSPEVALRLVEAHTEPRQFGFLGQRRVNVLLLNLALDKSPLR